MSDLQALNFVDPGEVDARWRMVLFGPPGIGKTVAACSAPAPILALSADRPGAYRYARRHHAGKDIREARFSVSQDLRNLYAYARANEGQIATVILDPFSGIYDQIIKENTRGSKPDYQGVNRVIVEAIKSFRELDVNLVIVAYEKQVGDDDTESKTFAHLGGESLIQKVMGEMDLVARVFRKPADEDGPEQFMGQLVTARGYQCKDSSNALGRVRPLDLTEWFDTANREVGADESDIPFSPDFDEAASDALDAEAFIDEAKAKLGAKEAAA